MTLGLGLVVFVVATVLALAVSALMAYRLRIGLESQTRAEFWGYIAMLMGGLATVIGWVLVGSVVGWRTVLWQYSWLNVSAALVLASFDLIRDSDRGYEMKPLAIELMALTVACVIPGLGHILVIGDIAIPVGGWVGGWFKRDAPAGAV